MKDLPLRRARTSTPSGPQVRAHQNHHSADPRRHQSIGA